MIPKQTLENYPVFGDTGTKVKPDDAKYAAGFQQDDVLPAEWMNWAWNKNSKGITLLNAGVASIEAELISILTAAGITPSEATENQVNTAIQNMINSKTGTLANLTTSAKTNLVAAINENKANIDQKMPLDGGDTLTSCALGPFAAGAVTAIDQNINPESTNLPTNKLVGSSITTITPDLVESEDTTTIRITLPVLTLFEGLTIRLLLNKIASSTLQILTELLINQTTRVTIKVNGKNGIDYWNAGTAMQAGSGYDSTAPFVLCGDGTVLELVYHDGSFLIVGNPVVYTGSYEVTIGKGVAKGWFTKYADGYKRFHVKTSQTTSAQITTSTYTLKYPFIFSEQPNVIQIRGNQDSIYIFSPEYTESKNQISVISAYYKYSGGQTRYYSQVDTEGY